MKLGSDLQKLLNKAIDAHRSGDVAQASLLYQQLLEVDGTIAQALHNLGTIYFSANRFNEAFPHLKKAYEIDGRDADYMRGYGMALFSIGDLAGAEKLLRESLKLQPNDFGALEYLVRILNGSARLYDVIDLLEPLINGPAKRHEFLYYYCEALIGVQEHEKALTIMKMEVEKNKGNVQYLRLLGALYIHLSNYDEAVRIMRETVKMQPGEIGNWTNLCAACKGAYLFDEGIDAGKKALEMDPENFDAMANLGVLYREKGDPEEGMKYLHRALELRPAYANVHYNLGLNLVSAGYFREGWAESEWRWQTALNNHLKRPDRKPMWNGSDIGAKTLCIYIDQGVGDTMQMCRFFPEVFRRCPQAKIIFRCESKLIPLMRLHFGDRMEFVPVDSTDPIDFDYHIPVVTLLDTLNIDIDKVPDEAYLTAPQPIDYRDNPDQKIIGISWYTKSLNTGFKRSLDLREFAFLKDMPNVKIIDLQYGDTSQWRKEAAEIGLDVFHDDTVDAWGDLLPFLNQVAGCDLVISIDNTTVHTAGALGVPVWTITPYIPYWRWCLHDEQSPWYASMRFYKQSKPGQYDDVLTRIKDDTRKWLAGDQSLLKAPPYTPPILPYEQRQKKPLTLVIGAPDAIAPLEDQVSGAELIRLLEARGDDIARTCFREIEDTQVAPPILTDFDLPQYATLWRYKNPSLMDRIDRADHIVINGQAALHGTQPLCLKILYLAYYAKKMAGKKVSILNHSCFPEDGMDLTDPATIAFYRKVYTICDDVAVTDPLSQHLLTQLQISSRLARDAATGIRPADKKETSDEIAVFIHDMNVPRQAELLNQIGGLVKDQKLELVIPYYRRDQFGKARALQIASLVNAAACRAMEIKNSDDFADILQKSAALLTNHPVLISCAAALSKKLLALPATLPHVEGLCHQYKTRLLDPDDLSNIKDLAPIPPDGFQSMESPLGTAHTR